MNDDRDSNKEIDIGIIIRIFLVKKGFCVPVKLGNDSEIFIINGLVDIKGKRFFFIDY